MKNKDRKKFDLLEGRIAPTILRVALPTTLALLSSSFFHIADAFYLSHLATEAGAAVGVTFAFQSLMQAVGYTFGTGGGSLLSYLLGQKKSNEASSFASVAFYSSILVGTVILVLGLSFYPTLLPLLGASREVYPLAATYLRIFLWSAPAICGGFTLSQLLRAEGRASLGMACLIGANLLNVLLDPFLIFTLKLGITGAALATLISQWLGFLALIVIFRSKSGNVRLCFSFPGVFWKRAFEISRIGLPSFLRQGLICLATILINNVASAISVSALFAMTSVNRIFLLAYSFCAGIGQGMMSVIGYNYGAASWGRVRKAFDVSLWISALVMLVISLPVIGFAPEILSLFRHEESVIAFGSAALRAQMAVMVLHSVITSCSMALQVIKKPLAASLVACGRQGLFFLPLIFLLPTNFGAASIRYVQPLADLFSFLFTVPFWILLIRMMKKHQDSVVFPSREE